MVNTREFSLFLGLLLFFSAFSVQMVFAAPSFEFEFGEKGDGADELDEPIDLIVDDRGERIFVVDNVNNRINVFDEDGNDLFNFDQSDDSGILNNPKGIARDGDFVYLVDNDNNRILKIDIDGNCNDTDTDAFEEDICYVNEFGSSDSADEDYLPNPQRIAVHEDSGFVYVTDSTKDAIFVFDDDGNFEVMFFESDDSGPFNNPESLAIDNDEDILFVGDTGNDRIVIIDLNGNCNVDDDDGFAEDICYVNEFDEGEDPFETINGLSFDDVDNMLYVSDSRDNQLIIFEMITSGSCPSGTDEIVDEVCFVESFGSSGSSDGRFDSPSGLYIDSPNDLLYVVDTDNHRVQAFELTGGAGGLDAPTNLEAYPVSPNSIFISWEAPDSTVDGYKIEYREGNESFETLITDTDSRATGFLHEGLDTSKTYSYRVYSLNADKTSSASNTDSEKPRETVGPAALIAKAISPTQIRLTWFPPSDTLGFAITGYEIFERAGSTTSGDFILIDDTRDTSFIHSNLNTDELYSYTVKAIFSVGSSADSNVAIAIPKDDSEDTDSGIISISPPSSPRNISATILSSTSVKITWNAPSDDGNSALTGYKIESKRGSGSFEVLEEDYDSTSYTATDLTTDSKYTFRVSANNAAGSSDPAEVTSTPTSDILRINPMGKLTIDEGKLLSFTVSLAPNSLDNIRFSLENNPPSGAIINSESGRFSWTPTKSQGPGTYNFDIVVKSGTLSDRTSISITVNDVPEPTQPEPPKEPEPPSEPEEPKELGIAPFVDTTKDPQHYVDRYNNEPKYKAWFDENFPEYDSIYEAVGLGKPLEIPAPFVKPEKDPQSYVDRYNNEPKYKAWFDENYPEYDSIYQAVGLDEPTVTPPKIGECGEGTKLVDGVCTLVEQPREGGGCLIATAAYGSELSPQVQFLREIRDSKVMSTQSGSSFMTEFNKFYYSFSPAIADYERENPIFKEAVKLGITPMLSSLSILSLVDINSEQEMLGYGIAIIMANIGMYIVAPAMVVYGIKKSRLVRF